MKRIGKPLPQVDIDRLNSRIEHLLRQTGFRDHLPNGLPARCTRWDGLRIECEGGDHADYLFPVTAETSLPHEVLAGGEHINFDQSGHALIYTDGEVALTIYEACYSLWSVARDGEWISGKLQDESYRLSRQSVDQILAWCKEHGRRALHPNCEFPPP